MSIDDPVGATTVHGVCGIWGVVAVGLFAEAVPLGTTNARAGLFLGGGWYMLGVQSLAAVCLTVWGVLVTFIILFIVDKITPLRMDEHEELLGADFAEHNIEPTKCQCCCDSNEKETNHVETSISKSNNTTLFEEIGSRRENELKKRTVGVENFGYEGRFSVTSEMQGPKV